MMYSNAGALFVVGLTVIVLFLRTPPARSEHTILAIATVALLLWCAMHGGAAALILSAVGWSLFATRRLFSIGREIGDEPQIKYLIIDLVLMAVTMVANLQASGILSLAAAWFVIATWMRLIAFRFKEIGYAKSRGLVSVPPIGRVATGTVVAFATILFTIVFLHNWLIEILLAVFGPMAALLLSGLFAFVQTLTNREKRHPLPPQKTDHQRTRDALGRAHHLATLPHWLIMTIDIGLIAATAAVIVILYLRLKHVTNDQTTEIQVPVITRTRIKRSTNKMEGPPSPLRKLFAEWRQYGLIDGAAAHKGSETARECLAAFENSAETRASANPGQRIAAAEQLIARYELERYGEIPAVKEETESIREVLRQTGVALRPTKR